MLSVLPIQDLLLEKTRDLVLDCAGLSKLKNVKAFLVDIADLFYSLPHSGPFANVQSCTDTFGNVAFTNATRMSNDGFSEILSFHSVYFHSVGRAAVYTEGGNFNGLIYSSHS